MKKSINLLIFCLLVTTQIAVMAQNTQPDDSIILKKRIYKVFLITTDLTKSTGYLAGLSDSTLYLSSSPLPLSLVKRSDHFSGYSYDHLEKIEIKRKGAIGRSALQGALIGLAAGAIAGLVSGDDKKAPVYNNPNDPFGTVLVSSFNTFSNSFALTAGEKAVAYGILGAGTGSLVGVLVGSLVKKKFIIGRNKQKFHSMRENILEKIQ